MIAQKKQLTEQSLLIGAWASNEIEKQLALSFSEKRIRDYKNQDMDKIVELIGEWRYLLGVSNQASERELIIFTKFIHENYPNLTYTDIRTTMMMAISGKIRIEFTPMVNFSAKYVGDCIAEYLNYKSRFVNDALLKNEQHERSKQKEVKPATPEEQYNNFKSILISCYNMVKQKGEMYDFEDRIYNWLRKTKQLKMNEEDVRRALDYGNKKFTKVYTSPTKKDIEKKEQIIKKYGREHAVVQYFQGKLLTEIIANLSVDYFKKQP